MLGKIALEECWMFADADFNAIPVSQKSVIGNDLNGNLIDVHGQRLQQMDENGVDHFVLSFVSPGAQGEKDQAAAEALASRANERIEEEVMKNPHRFSAMVSLSMHDPVQAGEELRRCFTQRKGFVGVMLNDFQSSGDDGNTMLFYDDPKYDAFWKVADELRAPVYIHPRSSTPLISDQMWKGRPWLKFSALGYANRVNMHLLGIITSGVLDRFANLKLVVGHMGEHMFVSNEVTSKCDMLTDQSPYDLYRIDHKLNRARFPNMPMRKDRLIRDYFGSQVFITTSGHFSSAALVCAMTEIGPHSIMFSVDYPFESIPNGCLWFDEYAPLSIKDTIDIGRNNCLGVFPRLRDAPHGLISQTAQECEVGGLRGTTEYGLYNKDWSRRLERT
ncbi:MAG: hypothetical protein Q9162_006112 [Coniocarpon cinnabarinum]